MSSNTTLQTSIETILDDGVDVEWGEEAQRRASESTRSVGEIVATTMGPYGRDKLIVNNGGNVHITNDAVTILRNLHLTDPVSRTVRELANSQIFNAGDGTTTTLVLAGELLSHAHDLRNEGVHPTKIIEGYRLAAEAAERRLGELATTYDITDREIARDVARTTLNGSNATYQADHLSDLALTAVERVTDGYDVDLNAIRLRTLGGRDMAASTLVSGAILEAIPENRNEETRTGPAEILLVDDPISRPDSDLVDVIDGENYDRTEFAASEQEWTQVTTERIQSTGATVVISSDSIDDKVHQRLRRQGVTCLTNISSPDTMFLRRVFEPSSLAAFDTLESTETVSGSITYDWDQGQTTVTTSDSHAVTVKLFSQSDSHREELENTMSDAIEVIAQVAYDGRVIPGGGAAEIEMARHVRGTATKRDDKAQLAAFVFADALEMIPRILAQNAGLDPIDHLNAQRSAHAEGRTNAGIQLETGEVIDVTSHGIRDTLLVKRHALSNSVDAVCMLARVDGILEKEQL